jgi:hypothetical protein
MGSVGIKTTGDGKPHWIEEKVQHPPVGLMAEILFVQYEYDEGGNSVAGGPMAVGVEGAIVDVLEPRDGKAYHWRHLAKAGWNDNGNVCYFTIDWGGWPV